MEFTLKDSFIEKYKHIEPDFGFNGLGNIVYLRTYSRIKEDGTNEKWYETVRRVVEGTYSIQKKHITNNGLGWNEEDGYKSAQEMYDRMFTMKFLPPGRGLWAMGTPLIMEKGLFAALNNCAFTSTEHLDVDLSKPFEFMMDMSMLGVGVGFDVKGEGKVMIQKPLDLTGVTIINIDNQIPDTREGWVASLKRLLESYFLGLSLPHFDYSLIRPNGSPIKTFGGKSAGPEPLMKLHEHIKETLDRRIGQKITATDIVDIMNMIGVCVVAGNARRSSQIVFGNPNSNEFLKLKDYRWDTDTQSYKGSKTERAPWGWLSNNSVFVEAGQDYTKLAEQTASNGEPGYAWLKNMREYGRFKDGYNNKDFRVSGGNPCLEQSLEPYEMCCLVEVFPTRHEDKDDFLRTLKFAYMYAKTVTLGTTQWVETNRVQLRNRRIGTSISGIAQFVDTKGIETLRQWLEDGYQTIQHYDEIYSDWFAVPKSIKTTSIKPSGTVSLLPGVTPGMHYPESNYYIRRIRVSAMSDILPYLKEAGYTIEPDVNDTKNTVVVEIPVAIEGVRTTKEVSMWEQLSLAAFLQEHWADNQVSCTITFDKTERDQIKHALNYFQYKLKGISFLPKMEKAAYQQMPYEEITKEEYKKILKKIKGLKLNGISEDSKPEMYCNNDTCEIA
jgi:adenosylcobalamin-dependent ribonucleoside-triphosphate reductase